MTILIILLILVVIIFSFFDLDNIYDLWCEIIYGFNPNKIKPTDFLFGFKNKKH